MKRSLCIIAALLTLASAALAGPATVRLRPDTDGRLLGWLVLGPLPNPGMPHTSCQGFDTDYLAPVGGEAAAVPSEGQTITAGGRTYRWRLAPLDARGRVDFVKALGSSRPGVAYAYATIESPVAQDARVLLGSDDGVKLWVNNALVHTNHVGRWLGPDSDKVSIRLVAGTNRILAKVDQGDGGWGFMARIVGMDDKPIANLTETLDILSASRAEPAEAVLRALRGRPGTLDLPQLLRFDECKRQASLWMPWLRGNPGGATALAKAIRQMDARVKAAPKTTADQVSATYAAAVKTIEQRYNAEWDTFTRRLQNPGPLIKTDPAKEDYIRVAPGGRYFVHADGRFYTPLGYNQNPDWSYTHECSPTSEHYNPAVTDRFFKHLHDSGVNLLRMMVESPAGGFLLENPVGTFRPEQVVFIDNVVRLARKHGIKLMITPWDTFWMSHRWDTNPFNSKLGGPIEKKVDFVTKREAIELEKRRWKFIIDRWGNTGTVFAWELLNESDYWWDGSPAQLTAWATEMGDFVRSYEKQKWGRNHLVTISTGRPVPKGDWAEYIYRLKGMDLASTHLYLGAANAPEEPIGPARAIAQGVTYALDNIKDNRPFIDGEDGPINRWIADGNLDNRVFHHMVWAHLASGGAGSGLRWPYRNPHVLSDGMLEVLSRMSRFCAEVPWQKLCASPTKIQATAPDGWVACTSGTRECALLWTAGPGKRDTAVTLTITWPDGPASVRCRLFDTDTAQWLPGPEMTAADGKLILSLPPGHQCLAAVLERTVQP